MVKISVALLSLFVSGCASFKTPMKNAEGHVIECRNSGWGWVGAPAAYVMQRQCESEFRERGYIALSDVAPPNIAKNKQQQDELKTNDQNKDPAPISGEIEKLHEMRKAGALTEEEFTIAKQRLLSR